MQSMNAEVQANLRNADTNVSIDVKSEPLVDPISLDTTTMGIADTLPEYHTGDNGLAAQPIDEPASISSNNATMGMAHTSPEDHTVRGGLLESNHGTDDPKDESISPEKLKFTEAIQSHG